MNGRPHVPVVERPDAPAPDVPTQELPAVPENEGAGLPVRRALISVWEKRDIEKFARGLAAEKIDIVSTGGTFDCLKQAGIPVTHIRQLTGAAEALGGRVKTLDRAIHIGILADRDDPEHVRQLEDLGIQPIDLVCVNLKPFEIAAFEGNNEMANEMIDIGGATLLRAAAKNHQSVVTVASPFEYNRILEELRGTGEVTAGTSRDLAGKAFEYTADYDGRIAAWLQGRGI